MDFPIDETVVQKKYLKIQKGVLNSLKSGSYWTTDFKFLQKLYLYTKITTQWIILSLKKFEYLILELKYVTIENW